MKKKKAQNDEEREEPGESKPWLLMNISPQVREMAKDSARKHNVKVAEWVTHAIIKTHRSGEDETVHVKMLSELMEEFPDKEFMKNWFIGLRGKIEDLSEKIDKTYTQTKIKHRPWWKFWH